MISAGVQVQHKYTSILNNFNSDCRDVKYANNIELNQVLNVNNPTYVIKYAVLIHNNKKCYANSFVIIQHHVNACYANTYYNKYKLCN